LIIGVLVPKTSSQFDFPQSLNFHRSRTKPTFVKWLCTQYRQDACLFLKKQESPCVKQPHYLVCIFPHFNISSRFSVISKYPNWNQIKPLNCI
jgi:hypothetical protein